MSTKQSRKVTTQAVSTGVNFGCVGVVRDAKSGRKLATTERVYPHGHTAAAHSGAEAIAEAKGWTVVEAAS